MRKTFVIALTVVLGAGLTVKSFLPIQDARAGPQSTARVLSISSNPRARQSADAQAFFEAIELAYRAGARGDFTSWTWKVLEPKAGRFNLAELKDGLGYLGNTRGSDLLLGLQVINTTAKETPSDLGNVPFDAPAMKKRFRALLDALRPHLNRHVKYISVGNEVDVYLSAHPQQWAAYKAFYNDAVSAIHAMAPWIKVGVTVTYDGALANRARVEELNGRSDIFILTYYPLGDRFIPRPPNVALSDIPKMVDLAKSRPLILQEVGYPTSATLASSEEHQAQFVTSVFRAWNASAARIPFLNFFLLHDLAPQTCAEYARYYGLPTDGNFQSFLCSLGLRTADGKPKLAWPALVKAAKIAGLK